jgi:hypothetical protein
MKKDLLIGAADLYDWSKIKVWATSIRESGFDGDIILLTYRVGDDVVENAKKLNVDVYQIEHDSFGNKIVHVDRGRDTQCHQLRFFHAWQFLATDENWKNYRNVLMTDVRDVYFQKNPFTFLDSWSKDLFFPFLKKIVASSEALSYKHEVWGADNMLQGFGPLVHEQSKEWIIYNVGVVAGNAEAMMGLFLILYSMTVGRYIPSDQSAYNILVNQSPLKFNCFGHDNDWACQCGTTLDPNKSHYDKFLKEGKPKIVNGKVMNVFNEEFYIVHQWDRVPELQQLIEKKYA